MCHLRPSNTVAWKACLCAAAILLVSGCATVELASAEEDAAAKLFIPPEGKANIYVARKGHLIGSEALFQIVVDGKVEGGIVPGTYQVVSVNPGIHIVSVTTTETQSTQEVDAVSGECYFFEVKPKIGNVITRAEVVRLTEPEGREAIADSLLAEDIQPDS